MEWLDSRPVVLPSGTVDYLGRAAVGGAGWFFFRREGDDVAVRVAPDDPARPAFRAGRTLAASFALFPDGTPAFPPALLDELCRRLLTGEDRLAREIAAPAEALPPAEAPGEGGSLATFRLPAAADAPAAAAHLVTRGEGELDLAMWSLRLDPGSESHGGRRRAQRLIAAIVSRLLSGGKIEGVARPAPPPMTPILPPPEPSTRTVSLDLARGVEAASAAAGLRVDSGDRLAIHVLLGSRCDQECVFCRSDAHKAPVPEEGVETSALDAALPRLVEVAERAGEVVVTLSGADPLRAPALEPVLATMRRALPEALIGVITPGTLLSDKERVKDLKRRGLDFVELSIHGPDAATHDAMVGRAGAFDEVLKAIPNVRFHEIECRLSTVVVAGNLDRLLETLALVRSMRMRVTVRAYAEDRRPLEVSRDLCFKNSALAGILDANREPAEGAIESIRNVPYCVLPAWARRLSRYEAPNFEPGASVVPAACGACPRHGVSCASVGPSYLALFGDDELAPVP
jgi:molybdenum cofactor biosynthesis enzyme MoaA